MRRRTTNKNRRRGSSGAGTPTQLLGDQLQLRVEPGRISPAARTVYGVERYTDPLQSGTPRQMLPKYAVTLNGSTEYINAGSIGANRGRTIAAWVKVNSLPGTNARFFSNISNSPAANSGIDCYVTSTGEVGLFLDGVATVSSAGVITAGTWYLLSVTVASDGTVSAAINASEVVTGTVADVTSGNDLLFGRYGLSSTSFLNGAFDDIRVFDGVMPQADLLAIAGLSPGSQSGAAVSLIPSRHYKCEDPVTSTTLRNSGSLGSVADATITTAAIATVRGTASPVYSFANSVGGTQAWCSDGVDDYLDTQLTLDGATALTLWRRYRPLSRSAFDFDGFLTVGAAAVRIGYDSATPRMQSTYSNRAGSGDALAAVIVATNQPLTDSFSATVGGSWAIRRDDVEVGTGSTTAMQTISNSLNFYIGASNQSPATHFSHNEYYEYLIADRVLTDDELAWLETGGQTGTAIDFENDANILLYTDFSQQTATQIVNQANPNLPILKASGGELTMVPRSESDTTKDVDQADYSYRTAVYFPGDVWAKVDMGSALIPATGDFDISVRFNLHATDAADTFQTLLSQFKTSSTDGRFLWRISKASLYLDFLIVNASPGNTQLQSSSNSITAGRWHTARVSRVGDVFTMWLDGAQVATQTIAATVDTTSNTFIGQGEEQLTTHDEFNGLISNLDINGTQYLTTPNETISGATLTNASYVNVVRGKPGTLQHTGIAPRDMPLSSPCVTLDGVGDAVELDVARPAGTLEFSVAFWARDVVRNDFGRYFTIGQNPGRGFNVRQRTTSGDWDISIASSNADISDYIFTGGFDADTHIVVTVSGTTVQAYKNGTKLTMPSPTVTGSGFNGAVVAADKLFIGQNVFGGGFANARMSQVQCWERALTDAEAATVYAGGNVSGKFLHYPLTEGSGDVAHDVSGNGNDGVINGTLASIWATQTNVPGSGTLVADGYSCATWFDGSSDYFSGGAIPSQSAASFSVSAWVFAEATAGYIIADWMPAGNLRRWAFGLDSGKIALLLSGDGAVWNATSRYDSYAVPLNTWVHLAATHSGTETKFYANGAYLGAVSNATAIFENAGLISVGAFNDGQLKWTGALQSCIAHYGAVWSDAVVAAIMAAGKTSEIASIVGDLGGAAWYFPDAKTETLQNLSSLTVNGAPEQRVIPAGTGLPPISYGPGLLPPGCSLDLYCNEDDAPFSQGLAALLTDGDYAFDDGGPEGDSLFRKTTDNGNGEELAVIKPAATGAELTILQAWDSD